MPACFSASRNPLSAAEELTLQHKRLVFSPYTKAEAPQQPGFPSPSFSMTSASTKLSPSTAENNYFSEDQDVPSSSSFWNLSLWISLWSPCLQDIHYCQDQGWALKTWVLSRLLSWGVCHPSITKTKKRRETIYECYSRTPIQSQTPRSAALQSHWGKHHSQTNTASRSQHGRIRLLESDWNLPADCGCQNTFSLCCSMSLHYDISERIKAEPAQLWAVTHLFSTKKRVPPITTSHSILYLLWKPLMWVMIWPQHSAIFYKLSD